MNSTSNVRIRRLTLIAAVLIMSTVLVGAMCEPETAAVRTVTPEPTVAWAEPTATVQDETTLSTPNPLEEDPGTELWSYDVPQGEPRRLSAPSVADGVVYVGSDDHNLYVIDASNGELIWRYETGDSVRASAAVAGGVVYVGSDDHNLYAIDASSGELIWRYETGDSVRASAAVADGVVYVGSTDHNVYAINASSGELNWRYETGNNVWGSATVADGVVYVGSADHNVYAIDASNGVLLRRLDGGGGRAPSLAVAEGVVYVASSDLYAIVAEPPTEFSRSPVPPLIQANVEEIHFTGIVTVTNPPSQVQVVFSLRDQNGHAIVLPADEVQKATQVYESRRRTQVWEEIDYAETSFFVHTAEKFDLEVVFALDFTNSMAQAKLPDGRGAIDAMIDAFESGLGALPSAHRIGVVEFHDRNIEPGVLSTLTTDRKSIRESVNRFVESGFDPGSSRVWDSVVAGANLFSTREQNPRAVRALVFLSDGRDTSSVNLREDALRYALERGVQLYSMGVGEVFQEEQLRQMADSTSGAYYPVRDPSQLEEQLQLIVNDLRGQYQLSYITLRKEGRYQAIIAVELDDVRGSMETDPFDAATFFGSDNQGVVHVDPPTVDRANGQATVFVRALHMPRNIDRIRFRLDTSKPVDVDLVPREDGGLLDGWALSGPGSDGYFEASSPTPLAFGNFGLLFRLTLSDVSEQSLEVPLEFDNSFYTAGKRLGHPPFIEIGPPLPPSGRIAFESGRDGNWEIYVMNADGSDVARLTDYGGDDVSPAWSPNGQRIAFSSWRDGLTEIYVMNADGSDVARLTDYGGDDVSPAWSPNGQRIAFSSGRDGQTEIYVMNADGSGVARLTDHAAEDVYPAWSPDGQRIAFSSLRDRNWEIYVMNADGSDVARLTDHGGDDFEPTWSPDGRYIAFASDRDGDLDIFTMRYDGSEVTNLTDQARDNRGPHWAAP